MLGVEEDVGTAISSSLTSFAAELLPPFLLEYSLNYICLKENFAHE
jgi:hypothetical protein